MLDFNKRPELWKKEGRGFNYRGYNIFYKQQGTGPVLLLLHGFPTSSFDWLPLWEELSNRYRVVTLDFIGFGYSDKPVDYEYSIVDQADLVQSLLHTLKIDRVHILTHDYGVSVAQELLARYNKAQENSIQLESIAFLNGGLFPDLHRPRFLQKLLNSPLGFLVARLITESTFRKRFSEVFGPNTQPSDLELKEFWSIMNFNQGMGIYHKLIRYIGDRRVNGERWKSALLEAKIPLRLINGPADPVSGVHLSEYYKKLIPGADVVSLEGIGHYPQTEAPKQTLKAFLDFQGK